MAILRRLLLAAALAVSATLLVPAGPASAALSRPICSQLARFDGSQFWYCYEMVIFELKVEDPGPGECPYCAPTINIWDDLDPEIRQEYLTWRGEGMQLLSKSAISEDPGEIKELRAMATDAFLTSAEILGKSEVKLEGVGWVDLENDKFYEDPIPHPALEAAGQNLVEGLTLMQQALGDPDPQPSIEAAMAQFDEAHQNLASLYVG